MADKVKLSKDQQLAADGLNAARTTLGGALTSAQATAKGGDTKAMRRAIAAENDLNNLKRVCERVESGFYA